jgi:hypothetical protein
VDVAFDHGHDEQASEEADVPSFYPTREGDDHAHEQSRRPDHQTDGNQ